MDMPTAMHSVVTGSASCQDQPSTAKTHRTSSICRRCATRTPSPTSGTWKAPTTAGRQGSAGQHARSRQRQAGAMQQQHSQSLDEQAGCG